jgi:phospholipid/cholesterol/gamma-HCH transport system substrate-binding protein
MVSKAQKFRLGLFIAVFTTIMIFFIIMVAGNKLMEKRDYYNIKYRGMSVSGLQIGGAVKYNGINVGRVDNIKIQSDDIRNVIVEISVEEGTPIKSDMQAILTPVGITGLLQVELTGGTNNSSLLQSGDTIKAGTSTFQNITGKAEILAEKLEMVLNNIIEISGPDNQKKLKNIIANVDSIIYNSQKPLTNIVTQLDTMSIKITELVDNLNQTTNRVNQVLHSEEFNNILVNSEKFTGQISNIDLPALVENVNKTVEEVDYAVRQINTTHLSGKDDLLDILDKLQETVDNLDEFSRMLLEDPTILLRGK